MKLLNKNQLIKLSQGDEEELSAIVYDELEQVQLKFDYYNINKQLK